jgi:single-strand DNA-binding protein
MSEGLNRIYLLGNLGADPELRAVEGGSTILRARIATESSYLDRRNNQRSTRVEWHALTIFGRRAAALAKILCKGSRVLVEGELHHRHFTDAQGQTRTHAEVFVRNLVLAGGSIRLRDGVPAAAMGDSFSIEEDPGDTAASGIAED